MLTFWFRVPDGWEMPESITHQNYSFTGQRFEDGTQLLMIDHPEDPQLGLQLVGAWNKDGTLAEGFTVDQTAYEEIRPLGNNPDGSATPLLRAIYPAGMPPYHLEPDTMYPKTIDPFGVEIRHKEFFGDWPGWGWRAEMIYGTRDPSVYAIGVYSDPECTQYLYTTGAFVLMDSDWQTDEDGNPVQVWATETPAGRANPDKEDWHLALLKGAAQEGYQTLSAGGERIHYYYWPVVRGSGPSVYKNSGQTVQGMAGTVTLVQDKTAFPIGIKIRINGHESIVTSWWAGGEGLILSPYKAHPVGAEIWYK